MNHSLRWKIPLLLLPIVPLLVWAYDRMHWTYGVGVIDLTIEYKIVDSATGIGIPEARLDFRDDEGGLQAHGFLLADPAGHTQHQFPDSTIATQRSSLNWTNIASVYLPYWSYSVSAPGFKSSPWQDLHKHHRETRVNRENRQATLTILVRLEKE